MKRVSFSGQEKTVEDVWNWYQVQSTASSEAKDRVLAAVQQGTQCPYPLLQGLSLEELDDFFEELDYVAMLDLMAAAEAAVRLDFLNRIYDRRKDKLSRQFRDLYQAVGDRIKLDEHILRCWTEQNPSNQTRRAIGNFLSALSLRNWLAHGRYFNPKLGRDYSALDIYSLVVDLLIELGILPRPEAAEGT